MLMLLIGILANRGAKYHNEKIRKHSKNTKEYAYHLRMLMLYTNILEITVDSNKPVNLHGVLNDKK